MFQHLHISKIPERWVWVLDGTQCTMCPRTAEKNWLGSGRCANNQWKNNDTEASMRLGCQALFYIFVSLHSAYCSCNSYERVNEEATASDRRAYLFFQRLQQVSKPLEWMCVRADPEEVHLLQLQLLLWVEWLVPGLNNAKLYHDNIIIQ